MDQLVREFAKKKIAGALVCELKISLPKITTKISLHSDDCVVVQGTPLRFLYGFCHIVIFKRQNVIRQQKRGYSNKNNI